MKKRFIAGAICPKCASKDSIMAFEDTDLKLMFRECVDCGFSDKISTQVNRPKEVKTRVTQSKPTKNHSDPKAQVIKIIR